MCDHSTLLLAGCSLIGSDGETFGSNGVTATLEGQTLTIENQREQEIWTFVIGRTAQASASWAVAVGEKGEGLAFGEKEAVDLEDVLTVDDEESINVHWWEAVVEDGERVPGSVSTFRVER